MSVGTYLLLCLGGGAGAVLRFVLDGLVKARVRTHIPVGTMLINLTGCLALGVLAGLAHRGALGSDALAVLGTGVLGGYTTFSTASFETARLLQDGRRGPALWSGLGALIGGVALASLGLWLGLR